MLVYAKITYDNGYAGSIEEQGYIIEAETEEKAYDILDHIADESLCDYAEQHCVDAEGYDCYDGWESEELEDRYYEGCSYDIETYNESQIDVDEAATWIYINVMEE